MIFTFSLFVGACGGDHMPVPEGEPSGDRRERVPPGPNRADGPTWDGEVSSIMSKRCSACHVQGSGLPVWDYQTATSERYFQSIKDMVYTHWDEESRGVASYPATQVMPLNNQTGITPEERMKIKEWVDIGGPKTAQVTGEPAGEPERSRETAQGTTVDQSEIQRSFRDKIAHYTYDKRLREVLQKRCTWCHNSVQMPGQNYAKYEHLKRDAQLVESWVIRGGHPNQRLQRENRKITKEEKELLQIWIDVATYRGESDE